MRTTKQHDLSLIYAIGIPTVLAFFALSISTIYLIGFAIYSNYLEPKVEPIQIEISQSRKDLEAKHLELLKKSGFRNDVKLGSLSDVELQKLNYKLEKALREAS